MDLRTLMPDSDNAQKLIICAIEDLKTQGRDDAKATRETMDGIKVDLGQRIGEVRDDLKEMGASCQADAKQTESNKQICGTNRAIIFGICGAFGLAVLSLAGWAIRLAATKGGMP